jgi:carboxypeptidase PM20D1
MMKIASTPVRKTALAIAVALAMLAAVLGYNVRQLASRQPEVPPAAPLPLDGQAAAARLAEALRFKTVSTPNGPADAKEFRKLHDYLARTYPRVHAQLRREVVNDLSLLYTWPGTDAGAKPILLMAHQDVVPIEPATASQWKVEPFAGVIQDGVIWGRGAWDDKSNLLGHMEAIELLLAQGFKPRQTIYLAYGHDEEVGGRAGAAEIARLLRSRNVKLDFVLDEGLVLTEGILKGVERPAALVGIAEKGYLSVVLRANGAGGHSLMPPSKDEDAIGMLAAALRRIHDSDLPAGLRGVTREMFETLAPEMPLLQRVALSNLWLFAPMVQAQLEQGATTRAMMRTTTALTMLNAGVKENVIPGAAEATLNFRLMPGDSREAVMAHLKARAGEGRYELRALPDSHEASPVTPTASGSYQRVARSVRAVFPQAVVAPALVMGGTDTKHFVDLSDHIYRFSPVRVKPGDSGRIHGINERLGVKNYAEMVAFYHQLITDAGQNASAAARGP